MALTPSSEAEGSDALAKRAERAGEGDRPLPRFPLEWDLSRSDDRLRRLSGREDSQARSHRPGKVVAEAAPAGVHSHPRVAAIAGSTNSFRAIPATPSRPPTPLPRPRAVRRRRVVT